MNIMYYIYIFKIKTKRKEKNLTRLTTIYLIQLNYLQIWLNEAWQSL
jgi:hypothetical protein